MDLHNTKTSIHNRDNQIILQNTQTRSSKLGRRTHHVPSLATTFPPLLTNPNITNGNASGNKTWTLHPSHQPHFHTFIQYKLKYTCTYARISPQQSYPTPAPPLNPPDAASSPFVSFPLTLPKLPGRKREERWRVEHHARHPSLHTHIYIHTHDTSKKASSPHFPSPVPVPVSQP